MAKEVAGQPGAITDKRREGLRRAAEIRLKKAEAAGNTKLAGSIRQNIANLGGGTKSGEESTMEGRPDTSTTEPTTPARDGLGTIGGAGTGTGGQADITTTTTPGETTEAPAATTPAATTSTDPAFTSAQSFLDQLRADREESYQPIRDAQQDLQATQESTFERLYGADSSLQTFFNPALATLEQTVLDIEEDLDTLGEDITTRFKETGLNQAQFSNIEAKERSGLIKDLDRATRAFERLTAGREFVMEMADKEYEAELALGQQAIDYAVQEFEALGMPEAELAIFQFALQEQYDRNAEYRAEERLLAAEAREEAQRQKELTEANKDALNDVFSTVTEMVLGAGVVPSDNFEKVIQDAFEMVEEGEPISLIQTKILQAVGDNPAVRSYITKIFSQLKSSGGPGSLGNRLSSSDIIALKAEGYTNIPYYDSGLTQEQAETLMNSSSSGDLSLLEQYEQYKSTVTGTGQ